MNVRITPEPEEWYVDHFRGPDFAAQTPGDRSRTATISSKIHKTVSTTNPLSAANAMTKAAISIATSPLDRLAHPACTRRRN